MNYTILKSELLNDPQGLGYAVPIASGADHLVAQLINDSTKSITINRGVVASYEIVNCIDPSEWAALTAVEKQRLQFITSAGQVDVKNQNIVNMFKAMFAAGSVTRDALIAMGARPASRAEKIGLPMVSVNDIARALRG